MSASLVGSEMCIRDSALLAPEEIRRRWAAVVAVSQVELETWARRGCTSREKRSEAHNIIVATR
eukprot:4736709-Alexandrium_andersonii.AAC.1